MANIIQIKTGQTPPKEGTLTIGELGYDLLKKKLYVGGQLKDNGKVSPVELTDRVNILKQIPSKNTMNMGEIAFCLEDENIYIGVPQGSLPEQTTYTLQVSGGKIENSSGVEETLREGILPGSTITIMANSPGEGQHFVEWDFLQGEIPEGFDIKETKVTFRMPSNDIIVSAIFGADQPKKYNIITHNCDVTPNPAAYGETVTVTAATLSGQKFSSWSSDPWISFANQSNPTTFTMPNQEVTITANYEKIPQPSTNCKVTLYNALGYYADESIITINKGEHAYIKKNLPAGTTFVRWTISPQNAVTIEDYSEYSKVITSINTPDEVTITAEYRTNQPTTYKVTLQDCSFEGSTGPNFTPGTSVTVKANQKNGYTFKSFDISQEVNVNSNYNGVLSFTMPPYNVTIKAVYTQNDIPKPVENNLLDKVIEAIQSNPAYEKVIINQPGGPGTAATIIDSTGDDFYYAWPPATLSFEQKEGQDLELIIDGEITSGSGSVKFGVVNSNSISQIDTVGIYFSGAGRKTIRQRVSYTINPNMLALSGTSNTGKFSIKVYSILIQPSVTIKSINSIKEQEEQALLISKQPIVKRSLQKTYDKIDVIPYKVPKFIIDPTLQNSGEAADALAVSQAIKKVMNEVKEKMSPSGGTFTGKVTFDAPIILKKNVHYGNALPPTGQEGQIFFLEVAE